MSDKSRLGKGLEAIFGDDVSAILDEIQQGTRDDFGSVKTKLKVEDIRPNPYQPRQHFDDDKLLELANSILQHGLFTPILVRESTQGYEVIAGERRLRACKIANLSEIDAIIVNFDDAQMMEVAIVENIQREDLNVLEEAQGFQVLIENLGLTQEEVAKRISKSRSYVANILRLLKLPEPVQNMVRDEKLTMGHVRPLITLEEDEILEYAQLIHKRNLNVRQAENLIKNKDKVTSKTKKPIRSDYMYVQRLAEEKLQTRVEVLNKRLLIHFMDDEDLNRVLDLLGLIEKE